MKNGSTTRYLGTLELRDSLANGTLSALDLVETCLERIAAREDAVQAWAWIDPDFARAQARQLDARRQDGHPLGPLHGIPVGVKDMIDTADIPTQNGCPLDAGRVPSQDAFVVERLKSAGAILMGKTRTTELAFMHAGPTTNPHNKAHTPGGSSSGSVAAIADGMVPLAIGTQTGGSVIRPAAFCGITGFKPSFGAIPRRGVLMQSHTLDTVGVFAADPEGTALLADVLFGYDPQDDATTLSPAPQLLDALSKPPARNPVFAVVDLPGSELMHDEQRAAIAQIASDLGAQAVNVELPEIFEQVARQRALINFVEMGHYYARYLRDGADVIGEETRTAIEDGQKILATDYLEAVALRARLNAALTEIFARFDAILCPPALGPAPEGLTFTGDSIFNGLWTLCGTPAVTLPLSTASNGLPMGVQLVTALGQDAALLRHAAWLRDWIKG